MKLHLERLLWPMFALLLALLSPCASSQAAETSYQLSCVPAATDAMLPEKIKTWLDLHGWQEADKNATYRVCLRQMARQQTVVDPAMNVYVGGPYGGPYWSSPAVREISVPYVELSATRADGTVWREQQDVSDEGSAQQRLERTVRALIDRLPAE